MPAVELSNCRGAACYKKMLVEHMDTLDAAKEVRRDPRPASPALRPLRLTAARASARCLRSPIIWVRLRRCDAALRLSAAPAL